MSAKKKPIIVTITKGRHKKQPWTFKANMPGNGPEIKNDERYTAYRSAWRGALRLLKAQKSPMGGWFVTAKSGAVTRIEFVKKETKTVKHKFRVREEVIVDAGCWGLVRGIVRRQPESGHPQGSYVILITSGKHKGHQGYWLEEHITKAPKRG